MKLQESFIAQIDALLAEYEALKEQSQYPDLSDLHDESPRLAIRFQALFDRISRPTDTYGRQAEALRDSPTHVKIVGLANLSYALSDDLKAGWSSTFAELVRADTSAEMLHVAEDLSSAGYKDASAVVAGTALELHLRALARAEGIPTEDAKGKFRKADQIRQELHSSGSTTKSLDRRIQYWLAVRNSAAHGDYSEYSVDDVKRMLSELSDFVESTPA